jgi:osmotically-inducible protein OsmY
MNRLRIFSAVAIVALAGALAGALSGCAAFDKCSPENCKTDTETRKNVSDLVDQHREFGPPGTVRVQTVNGVVYLSGQLDSDFEIRSAEALARQVPGVKDVVNNLYPRSNAR